nr:reverse transcriptase domain-containing protein [Tanacetum cinerariifolium]
QDSLNSAAGGNFLDKMPRECLAIIKSKSKVCYSHSKPIVAKVSTNASTSGVSPDVAELKDMVKALLLDKKESKSTSCSRESSRGELCYLRCKDISAARHKLMLLDTAAGYDFYCWVAGSGDGLGGKNGRDVQ